ncbi:EcsC family protein [Flavihumibacter fluvii]|uniref:EcsC family protein n=1 Tax=Flavihumibacter fluvii TaxID=2838157 RepID=UPI001BDDF3F9|nr:EcsC family protein [Flavihumibacter fluvii]ULQ54799.1 EcsC family protein [Flavihumibacter fluvii]
MTAYELIARGELANWQKKMQRRPSLLNSLSKKVQTKINTWIPEKIHHAITVAIRQMVKGVIFGAAYTTSRDLPTGNLQKREEAIQKKIDLYRHTAAIEGGITGAGGILLGLTDFPLLIGIKLKLLFDIAALYGIDVNDYKERVYILHIFELAFSSDEHRKKIYLKMTNWDEKKKYMPDDMAQFDWRNFQQEYRDYIDLAKMAQLLPLIGAPVGIIANYRLMNKLGKTAINAYRMRILLP